MYIYNTYKYACIWDFHGDSVVKNPHVNAGDAVSIPGLGRSPEKEMATDSSIPAWEIPWTEKSVGLQSMGSQKESDMTQQ